MKKYKKGLNVCEDKADLRESSSNVDLEKTQSKMSCPKEDSNLSAIFSTSSGPNNVMKHINYLQGIEYHI